LLILSNKETSRWDEAKDWLTLKLQFGNPAHEDLASCLSLSHSSLHTWKQLLDLAGSLSTFSRDDSLGKSELPRLVYQAGAWETAECRVYKRSVIHPIESYGLPVYKKRRDAMKSWQY